jgi:hypothetical protein
MAMTLFCSRGERRPKKASLREEVPLHENVFCVPMCVKKKCMEKRELILVTLLLKNALSSV